MTTGLVILIYLLDSILPAWREREDSVSPGPYLVSMLGVVVVANAGFAWLCRRLEKTGRTRIIATSERLMGVARFGVVSLHAYGLISLGWSVAASRWTHSLPVVTELLIALPPLSAFVVLYWGYAPIQRRLREAVLWRHLHEGRPLGRSMSRTQMTWEHIRHSILLGLVPLLMLSAWRHAGEFAAFRWLTMSYSSLEWVLTGWQVLGIFVVLALSPIVLRFVWDTVPLEGGDLRNSVEQVFARNGVTAREVLVWQTSSGILNGALMGIIPRARYVLFTDALLQVLPRRQVEAVAAHEAGHGRLHHLPWLIGSMVVASLAGAVLFGFAMDWGKWEDSWVVGTMGILSTVGFGFFVLGFVSRRFELQADAFAAKDLSRNPPPIEESLEPGQISEDPAPVVTHESVASMIDALETVSTLNGMSPAKFTWRHGTVRGRQAHLASIVGTPLEHLPIDRAVRRMKWMTLGAAFLTIILGLALVLFEGPPDTLQNGTEPERAPIGRRDRGFEDSAPGRSAPARQSADRRRAGPGDGRISDASHQPL